MRRDRDIKKISPLVVLIFGVVIATGASSNHSVQTHFTAEDSSVKQPVPVPDSVLNILREDNGVRLALATDGISGVNIPLSWFSASAIHLSNSKDSDLVVMGEESLRGANVTTFWVFSAMPGGYKLVLTAPAHDLIVRNTRWKSHRDIDLVSMTAVEISTVSCRFDGIRYIKYAATSKAIR